MQHVPMSLVRDEDCCYYIIRILIVVYWLSLCYYRFVFGVVLFQPLCCAHMCVPLLRLTAAWSLNLYVVHI